MSEELAGTIRFAVTGDHGTRPAEGDDAWQERSWRVGEDSPSFPPCGNRECVDSRWVVKADGDKVAPRSLVAIATSDPDGRACGSLICWGWQDAERKRSNTHHCLQHLHYDLIVHS